MFYIDPNVHRDFKEICSREDESMTSKLEAWVRLYVQQHKKGNPQLMLPEFMPHKARPFVLCNMLDGFKEGEVHCQRRGLWVDAKECYGCERNRLRRK